MGGGHGRELYGKRGYQKCFSAWAWESPQGERDGRLVSVIMARDDGSVAAAMHREKDVAGASVVAALEGLKARSTTGRRGPFTRDAVRWMMESSDSSSRYDVVIDDVGVRGSLVDALRAEYDWWLGEGNECRSMGGPEPEDCQRYTEWLQDRVSDRVMAWIDAHPGMPWGREYRRVERELHLGPENPRSFDVMMASADEASPEYEHFVHAHFAVVSTWVDQGEPGDPLQLILVDDGGGCRYEAGPRERVGKDHRLDPLNNLLWAVDELAFWPDTGDLAEYRAKMAARVPDRPADGPNGSWTPEMLSYLRTRLAGRLHISEPRAVAATHDFREVIEILRTQGGFLRAKPAVWTHGIAQKQIKDGGIGL